MQVEGGKGGGANRQGAVVDSGTRCGAQRRPVEDGRWKVWETSRWTEFRAGREFGERV